MAGQVAGIDDQRPWHLLLEVRDGVDHRRSDDAVAVIRHDDGVEVGPGVANPADQFGLCLDVDGIGRARVEPDEDLVRRDDAVLGERRLTRPRQEVEIVDAFVAECHAEPLRLGVLTDDREQPDRRAEAGDIDGGVGRSARRVVTPFERDDRNRRLAREPLGGPVQVANRASPRR